MIIRQMLLKDLDSVYAMEQRCHPVPWTKKILKCCLLVGYDCRLFENIATRESSFIGFLIGRPQERNYHILNFCIDKPYQRQGLGKLFLRNLLQSLDNTCTETVSLEVRKSNHNAIRLYESLDFQQKGIKEDYYNDKNGLEDALVFIKPLTAK